MRPVGLWVAELVASRVAWWWRVSQEPPASWARVRDGSACAAPDGGAASGCCCVSGQRWPRGSSTASRRRRRPSSGAAAAVVRLPRARGGASSPSRAGRSRRADPHALGAGRATGRASGVPRRARRRARRPPGGRLRNRRVREGAIYRGEYRRTGRPRRRRRSDLEVEYSEEAAASLYAARGAAPTDGERRAHQGDDAAGDDPRLPLPMRPGPGGRAVRAPGGEGGRGAAAGRAPGRRRLRPDGSRRRGAPAKGARTAQRSSAATAATTAARAPRVDGRRDRRPQAAPIPPAHG